jgi:mono/diheme cytochrome c family protein
MVERRMLAMLSSRQLLAAGMLAIAVIASSRASLGQEEGTQPLFERDIFPILKAHCLKCHGLEGYTAELDLRTVPLMLRGGKHGEVVVRGCANESALYRRIAAAEMPPGQELKLTDQQIDTIRRWIDAGLPAAASDDQLTDLPPRTIAEGAREFWAFRPLQPHQPPPARLMQRIRTPVDAFVLAALEAKGIGFSPDADRLAQLRRVHFDLIGLPPTPQEIERFLADDAPDGYDRLLDRLLASPHFGERWGRHWLDAAGYVDVVGGDNDAGTIKLGNGKWLYRDYVVRSFNSDKPFDQYLVEQLAGDELVKWREADEFTPRTKELLIATGFLRTAADDTDENELNTADIRYGVLQHTMEVVASNLLAITLSCARCHDHKYDPISQRDYYELQAVFAPAFNPQSWQQPKQRVLADVSPAQRAAIEQHNSAITSKVEDINKRLAEVRRPYEQRLFEQKLAGIPEPIRADTKDAIQTPAEKRTEVQKYLAMKFDASLKVAADEVNTTLSDSDRARDAKLRQQMAELSRQKRGWGDIHAVYDVGQPMPTYLLRRGNHETPGPKLDAGFLTVLQVRSDQSGPTAVCTCSNGLDRVPELAGSPAGPSASSGRRLALARTLTDWSSPCGALVARVQANRVWQHLFGCGIVETSENFGRSGAAPSHPELLDWLASEFIANGRHFKPLIKLIMSSTAYRQASYSRSHDDIGRAAGSPPVPNVAIGQDSSAPLTTQYSPLTIDPDNQLLWRQRLRRLESEIVRDSLLAVSGQLVPSFGGPPVPIESRPDGTVVAKQEGIAADARNRRSIYLLARRNYHPTLLAVFDQPALPTNCTTRTFSAVVSQSLTMLNDEFVREQAERFAHRIIVSAANSPAERADTAFRIALGRSPTADELTWACEFLASQTRHDTTFKEPVLPASRLPIPDQQSARLQSAGETHALEACHIAMTRLCHVILNTSEFLYVE